MASDKRDSQLLLAELAAQGKPVTRKSVAVVAGPNALKHNGKLLSGINEHISPSPINGYASLVNFTPTSDQRIHRWFRYREGYSIDLVKAFIKDLPRGSVILDPFCGAGTSLLAAQDLGFPSIGFDVNPISTLVSRVKTTSFDVDKRAKLVAEIKKLNKIDYKTQADPKPQLKIIDKVFDKEILDALLAYRREIKKISDSQIREFIFVAWLSILEGVSNVYKEGNGLKYKNRKRTDEGYIHLELGNWQSVVYPEDRFGFVKQRFFDQLEIMVDDLDYMPKKQVQVRIIESDAETLNQHILPNSVAMAVFSPPYCNCFNYFKMYKVELWMGEFVSSYEDIQRLNRRGLRSHVETILQRHDDEREPISEIFASQLDGLNLWDRRIPKAVRGYFIDMKKVLENLYTVLRPGGTATIVVGNSAYGGIVIPTDAILGKIAVSLGFKFEKLAVARHLTTSSQQRIVLSDRKDYLRESILILTKEDPRHVDHTLLAVDEIPLDKESLADRVFAIKNTGLTSGTHKFHRYPGKFIPHVPRWAINYHLKNFLHSRVLDPFCGSGTTLVESTRLGIETFGIDIDPIARLVSRVKTRPIENKKLEKVVRNVSNVLKRNTKAKFRPGIPTLDHWFNGDAINDLGAIREVIETYKSDTEIYEFLIVCFAAIIRRVSNADNQTQKTYVSHTKIKVPELAKPLFISTLNEYSDRLNNLTKNGALGKCQVFDTCDARNFGAYWEKTSLPGIDAIVTSPPYLNSVDYVYNQMAEYFWIGDLFQMETQSLQNKHKKNYIGSDRIASSVYQNLPHVGISNIDELVLRLSKKSKKNAHLVGQYFIDMITHFENAHMVLKDGGHYVCVIGDSLVSGESIPVHELISECAQKAGFKFEFEFGYEIRNRHMRFPRMGRGGLVRYDWIINFIKG